MEKMQLKNLHRILLATGIHFRIHCRHRILWVSKFEGGGQGGDTIGPHLWAMLGAPEVAHGFHTPQKSSGCDRKLVLVTAKRYSEALQPRAQNLC